MSIFKKLTSILALLATVQLSSCVSETEHTALQSKYDSLNNEIERQNQLITQVDGQMDSIATLMDSIDIVEEDILLDLESGISYYDYVGKIKAIRNYMDRTNKELERLEQAVAASEGKNNVYEKVIANYKKMMKEKDLTISQLQEKVQQVQLENDALVKVVDLQNDEIANLQEEVTKRQQEVLEMESELITSKTETIKEKAEKYFLLAGSTEELGHKTSGLFNTKKKKAYYRQAYNYYKQAFELDASLDSAYQKMKALEELI